MYQQPPVTPVRVGTTANPIIENGVEVRIVPNHPQPTVAYTAPPEGLAYTLTPTHNKPIIVKESRPGLVRTGLSVPITVDNAHYRLETRAPISRTWYKTVTRARIPHASVSDQVGGNPRGPVAFEEGYIVYTIKEFTYRETSRSGKEKREVTMPKGTKLSIGSDTRSKNAGKTLAAHRNMADGSYLFGVPEAHAGEETVLAWASHSQIVRA